MTLNPLSDAIRSAFAPYYETSIFNWWLPSPAMQRFPTITFKEFKISNFRGVSSATLNLERNDMILLLGLNESGKTTILKAIETFDFRNDPALDGRDPKDQAKEAKSFFTAIRNKSDITSDKPTVITAKISLDGEIDAYKQAQIAKRMLSENLPDQREIDSMASFLNSVNLAKEVTLSRVIPFRSGKPQKSFYRFESHHSFAKGKTLLSQAIAQNIVGHCPYVIYFEDFKDMVPEKIHTRKDSDAYNPSWFEIIEGLFYSTDENMTVDKFLGFHSKGNLQLDDASTALNRVNDTLNKTFTRKWKNLSGVKNIKRAEISYNSYDSKGKYFELKIHDKDGSTFSVSERSKGAIWYLGFLMKTEFRRKKLRHDIGKPVYLIDEPASNLHPTAQENMLDDFRALTQDASLIYTTHSRYLVASENLKGTYVIERTGKGKVSCTRWGDYIKKSSMSGGYFQPLTDCLDIVPNNLDIPWRDVLIVEGISDLHALTMMHRVIYGDSPNFVIYPAGAAGGMDKLISLNIGWGTNYIILLDSDEEGNREEGRYRSKFNLSEEKIISHSSQRQEIEDYFSPEEKRLLRKFAHGDSHIDDKKVEKKEFRNLIAVICANKEKIRKVKNAFQSNGAISHFKELFAQIPFAGKR